MLPSLLISIPDGIIDLSWGHPSPRLHPVAALRKAAEYALTDGDATPLQYGAPQGFGPLLHSLAAFLSIAARIRRHSRAAIAVYYRGRFSGDRLRRHAVRADGGHGSGGRADLLSHTAHLRGSLLECGGRPHGCGMGLRTDALGVDAGRGRSIARPLGVCHTNLSEPARRCNAVRAQASSGCVGAAARLHSACGRSVSAPPALRRSAPAANRRIRRLRRWLRGVAGIVLQDTGARTALRLDTGAPGADTAASPTPELRRAAAA